MSSSHLKLVAAGLGLIVAVLTGVVTGIAGASTSCSPVAEMTPTPPGPQSSPTDAPGRGTERNGTQIPAPGGGQGGFDTLAAEQECTSSFNVVSALLGFAGALVAAGALGGVLLYAARQTSPSPVTPPTGIAAVPPSTADGQADKDRSTLVQTSIYVRDRVTSKAIADRLGWALHEVGVSELSPVGAVFDPALHEAGGSVDTEDPSALGTVAAVETVGYSDRGSVLRVPVVTVYRKDGGK